jgi:hypothetical protein
MFMKLWLEVKHSTINHYFAFGLIETDVFQMPQLHKHFRPAGVSSLSLAWLAGTPAFLVKQLQTVQVSDTTMPN